MVSEWVSDGFDWKPGELITSGTNTQSPLGGTDTHLGRWWTPWWAGGDPFYTHQIPCNFSVSVLLACSHPCRSCPCVCCSGSAVIQPWGDVRESKTTATTWCPGTLMIACIFRTGRCKRIDIILVWSKGVSLKKCQIWNGISKYDIKVKPNLNLTK